MLSKPKIVKDEDMTELQKEMFKLATRIGQQAYERTALEIQNCLNVIIKARGGLDQVAVWSFIGKVYNIFTASIIAMTMDAADQNGDNDCTKEQFFREFNYGTQLLLEIPDYKPLPGGIQRLK